MAIEISNQEPCKGSLDSYSGGVLRGWFADFRNTSSNIFYIRIDDLILGPFSATMYRQDLDDLEIIDGLCGFNLHLPVGILDNNNHDISLIDESNSLVVHSRSFRLKQNASGQFLSETALHKNQISGWSGQEKIIILAGFTNSHILNSNQLHLLRHFKNAGFYVVFSIATDKEHLNLHEYHDLYDSVLVRRNIGYDFGSWAHAYSTFFNEIKNGKSIYFVNDSIVGPLDIANFSIDLETQHFDICSITDSYQRIYHLQSYYWRVKIRVVNTGALDQFFFYNTPIAHSKEEAIQNYELNTAQFFIEKGFSVGAALDIGALHNDSLRRFEMKTKSALKYYHGLMGKEYVTNPIFIHVVNKIYTFLAQLLSSENLNPSHFFWNSIISNGFPFIKKELLIKNSINYPFTEDIGGLFKSPEMKGILYDLIRSTPTSFAYYLNNSASPQQPKIEQTP